MEKEMAEHNMRLLEEELRRTGFVDDVVKAMREKVSKGKAVEFYIPYAGYASGKRLSGLVHFERVSTGGPYAADHYTLDLGKDSGRPLRENKFHFTDGYEMNLRESFNLMQGRAVYREPLFDTNGLGYWVTLQEDPVLPSVADLNYERATRTVEDALAVSPIGRLLTEGINRTAYLNLNSSFA